MRKYAVVLVIILRTVAGCKSNKSPEISKINPPSESNLFLEAYKPLKLPFSVSDTGMRGITDTNTISYQVFTQFVPDTIFNNPFGKNRKLSIHPIGRIDQKGKETYFLTLVRDKRDSSVYLSVYDKKKIATSMPLVATGRDDNSINTASIDQRYSIAVHKEWTIRNERFYKRTIYAYSDDTLTTVLTETNEDRNVALGVLNPFDTFPKKQKYSGDYAKGSKNFLFIRDGKQNGEYLFFVHFESENQGEPCGGELKGSLKMVSDKAGVYTGNGDACVLNISFGRNTAQVKETGSCGNYRGIKCFFNDTYTRKKEPKPSLKKRQAK